MHHSANETFRARWATIAMAIGFALTLVGCFSLEVQPGGGGGIDNGSGSNGGGSGGGSDDGDGSSEPLLIVELTASNLTPFVGETVLLTCTPQDADASDLTFAFTPNDRLIVDDDAGTAQLIIDETDLDTGLQFTCSATGASGSGPESDPVLITPVE
jgi:hypothetical protein